MRSVCIIYFVLLLGAAQHARAGFFNNHARYLQVRECDNSGKPISGTSYLFPLERKMWASSSDGKTHRQAMRVVDDIAGRSLIIDPTDITSFKQVLGTKNRSLKFSKLSRLGCRSTFRLSCTVVGQFSHHTTCAYVTGAVFFGKNMNSEVVEIPWSSVVSKCKPARIRAVATYLESGLEIWDSMFRLPKNRQDYMMVCPSPLVDVAPPSLRPPSTSLNSKEKFVRLLMETSNPIKNLFNPGPNRFRLPYVILDDATNWQASISNNKRQQQWMYPALDACLAAKSDNGDVVMSETILRVVSGDAIEFELCHNSKNVGRVTKSSVSYRLGVDPQTIWAVASHARFISNNLKVDKVLGAFQVTLLDLANLKFGTSKARERLSALGLAQDASWCVNCVYYQQGSKSRYVRQRKHRRRMTTRGWPSRKRSICRRTESVLVAKTDAIRP